ncbi:hypothetical protein EV14_3065 [Prochlorococcus sp. MIT 0703]|nr:hypothetical protein EV12_3100 [Prochlorococcus sp. MIT 0701]KGG30444.1 hypothetical protein EV14_3065 [Prochlorococcus sp. MIT 0703]
MSTLSDNTKLRSYLSSSNGVPLSEISNKDLNEVRQGYCGAMRLSPKYATTEEKEYCSQFTELNLSDSESLLKDITEPSHNETVKNNNIQSISAEKDSHSECLNARDYEGCIRVKSGVSSATANNQCKPNQWCDATSGNDILGMPQIQGWWMKPVPTKRMVLYRQPKIKKVLVRGDTNRYIVREIISRYYQDPRAGTAPTTTTIGSSRTNCSDLGSTISCTTTPATTYTTPGRSARPGGVRQVLYQDVIDCEERTVGHHVDGNIRGKWKSVKNFGPHSEEVTMLADKVCPIISNLELSDFKKYAKK